MYVTGWTPSTDFPTTAGALQPKAPGAGDRFLSKLSADGSSLLYSTYLGSDNRDSHATNGLAMGADGRVWLAGNTTAPAGGTNDFPVTAGEPACKGGVAVSLMDTTQSGAASLVFSSCLLPSSLTVGAIDVDAQQNVYLAGFGKEGLPVSGFALQNLFAAGFVVKLNFQAATAAPPLLEAVVSGASLLPGPVAAGQVVHLSGARLGPDTEAVAAAGAGTIGMELAGTRVFIGGIAAAVLAARADRVVAVVPLAIPQQERAPVFVEREGVTSNVLAIGIAYSAPGIFTADGSGRGQIRARNEDGTENSPSNPAARGSVVTFYLTGAGSPDAAGEDGRIVSDPPPDSYAFVLAGIGWVGAEVIGKAGVPGEVAGIIAVRVRIPEGAGPGDSVPFVANVNWSWAQPELTLAVR